MRWLVVLAACLLVVPVAMAAKGDDVSLRKLSRHPPRSKPKVVAPAVVTRAVLSGTPTTGQTVTSTPSTWSGTPTPTLAYQWQREAALNSNSWSDITGQTTRTHVMVTADEGHRLRMRVTATNSVSSVVDYSTNTLTGAGVDFHFGVVAGSDLMYELTSITTLEAKNARMEFGIGSSVASMTSIINAYVAAGVKPLLLAGFHGRSPSTGEAQNLGTWAAAFGPGGSAGLPDALAVTQIEFGNESSYSYQYPEIANDPNWANTAFYADKATQYALRAKEASIAIEAANPNVGLLAINDTPGNWTAWNNSVYAAVANFSDYVAGWTVHPYGPNWATRMDGSIDQATSHGAPTSIPYYVTEYGFATDNGRTLSDNYGWPVNQTYAQAATALDSTVSAMRSRYTTRLAGFYLFQAHDQQPTGTSSNREHYFGAVRSDNVAKGAITPLVMQLLASNP